jgi:hypothetical protein
MLAPEREMSAHGGEDRDGGGLRQALIACREQRGHGQPASRRVTRDQDLGRADTRIE